MAVTPAEWLPILAKRFDDIQPTIALRRSYVNGNAPLPEMSANTREAWIASQRKARTNYGGLAALSLCNRIRATSVMVGSDDTAPEHIAARRIFRDNRLPIQASTAAWDAVTVGVGYVMAGRDASGAVVTAESPEYAIAAPDPIHPWRARAFAKFWRDVDESLDYAFVLANGERQMFSRTMFDLGPNGKTSTVIRSRAQGGWELHGPAIPYSGLPPVVILNWTDERGFIAPHHDVIDRINLGKMQRLVTTQMQAFKQRFLEGGLPKTDPKTGNDIDYSTIFEYAPGALWDLPAGIKVSELSETDIRPMLEGEKADARDFAAVTGTPISVFVPDGANQSAEGASTASDQQIAQAMDAIELFKPALESIMVRALAAEGFSLDAVTLDIKYADPKRISMSERYQAAQMASAAGEPWESIARNVLDYTPEQIAGAVVEAPVPEAVVPVTPRPAPSPASMPQRR